MSNTKVGAVWPSDARNAGLWVYRNPASTDTRLNGILEGRVSGSSQHADGDIERTFVITKFWGIGHVTVSARKGLTTTATRTWKKFPLWLMSKSTGGYPYVRDDDVELFYFQRQPQKRGRPIEWTPQLYTVYLAKNETQVYAFNASSGAGAHQEGRHTGSRKSGYAPQGGVHPGSELSASEQDREEGWGVGVTQTGSSTPMGANEARLIFAAAMMDTGRWESDWSKQRADMDAIASNVRRSVRGIPPGIALLDEGGISQQIQEALIEAGYTQAQVDWYTSGGLTNPERDGVSAPWKSQAQADAAAPGAGAEDHHILPPTPALTKLVVRAPIGYVQPANAHHSGKPELTQSFMKYNDHTHRLEATVDRFFFPMIPNTVSYSGLGSRWVEIPRKGDFPIVEFSDWALMKVQFEFLVAKEMDGLKTDVAHQLNQLRRMAQRRNPVMVHGMDDLFQLQLKRAARTHKALQFVIADFTVQSQRRTIQEGNKEITAAQCSMTLQEMPIEEMNLVMMSIPPLADSSVPATPDVVIEGPPHLTMERSTQTLLAIAGIDTGTVTG